MLSFYSLIFVYLLGQVFNVSLCVGGMDRNKVKDLST